MNTFTLGELASRFGLTLQGDAAVRIDHICNLLPGAAAGIGFVANPKYRDHIASSLAAAVIVSPRDAVGISKPALVAQDPHVAYAHIAALFDPSRRLCPGVHPTAVIDPTAQIGAHCEIGPCAVIGPRAVVGAGCRIGAHVVIEADASLGADSRVEAQVTIGRAVRIGARANLQSGAVIGSRGFGNARTAEGCWVEVPQLGTVIVGDDVEIGANSCIDRGALGDTLIEDGVRLDNLVQIAHNCVIGAHTAIAANSGVAGSARVGKRCMVGGSVAINGHIEIVDDVVILGRSMVTHSLKKKGIYGSGMPVAPAREWRKTIARLNRLDKLQARVRALERLLDITARIDMADGETSND
jgi:UDP-3-O-[3-hydroxymyristoyl] glucosamine N-acyltransferase